VTHFAPEWKSCRGIWYRMWWEYLWVTELTDIWKTCNEEFHICSLYEYN
jgi:hypothetical protein